MKDNKNHLRTKQILKIVGICLLVAGAALTITGFASFFVAFGTGEMPSLFWCAFIGLPLLAVGSSLTSLGFRREFTGYLKDETVPVINEAGQEIAPAVSAITSAVKSADGQEDDACPFCGKSNDDGAKFCRHCGKALYAVCPKCGATVRCGQYCDKCGAKL